MDVAYAGQPEKVAAALWGAGQMMFNKVLVAAPADFPIRDPRAVSELLRGVVPERDLVFGRGVADVLDHAMARTGTGSKLLIDATGFADADAPEHPADVMADDGAKPPCATGADDGPGEGRPAADAMHTRDPRKIADVACETFGNFRALFDPAAEGLTPYEKLWLGLANIDPARDIAVSGGVATVDCRAKIPNDGNTDGETRGGSSCHDARDMARDGVRDGSAKHEANGGGDMPRRWPNVVVMDEATEALVDGRWAEYGLGERLPSPSARYRRLLLSEGAEV
jgi:4-hydroxy-3-polyprenylbenzoate decarboxylase